MIGLIQRVKHANVLVEGEEIATIQAGVLALIGIEKLDDENKVNRLLERILAYRIFPDEEGKMNNSLQDVQGGLLLVSQFTLVADTKKGNRPSFSRAAEPAYSEALWHYLVQQAEERYAPVAWGKFAADMQVNLCNDGPVTFYLSV